MGVTDGWVEIGDRVFVRRYAFYDQNIGVVLGSGEALVIDTRSTYAQARAGGLFRPAAQQAVTSQPAPPMFLPSFRPAAQQAVTSQPAPPMFLPSVHVVHLGRSPRPSCAGSRA